MSQERIDETKTSEPLHPRQSVRKQSLECLIDSHQRAFLRVAAFPEDLVEGKPWENAFNQVPLELVTVGEIMVRVQASIPGYDLSVAVFTYTRQQSGEEPL